MPLLYPTKTCILFQYSPSSTLHRPHQIHSLSHSCIFFFSLCWQTPWLGLRIFLSSIRSWGEREESFLLCDSSHFCRVLMRRLADPADNWLVRKWEMTLGVDWWEDSCWIRTMRCMWLFGRKGVCFRSTRAGQLWVSLAVSFSCTFLAKWDFVGHSVFGFVPLGWSCPGRLTTH